MKNCLILIVFISFIGKALCQDDMILKYKLKNGEYDLPNKVEVFSYKLLNSRIDFIQKKDIKIKKNYLINKNGVLLCLGVLSDDLPEVIYKDFLLLFDKNNVFLLFISNPRLIKVNSKGLGTYIGGIYNFRGKGNFYIFKYKKENFHCIFKTEELVLNRSFDCISYKGDSLTLYNYDVNSDGYFDLVFEGIELNYCDNEGNQSQTPYKQSEKKLIYLFKPEKRNWFLEKG